MSQAIAKFKEYIRSLIRKTKGFSLVELMDNLERVLIEGLFGTQMFNLVKLYYQEVNVLSGRYKLQKKLSKNLTQRKELRKKTAKEFFNILERLGAIIPKWLLAMPENLQKGDFKEWQEKTEQAGNRELAECVKDFFQFCCLRNKLCNIGDVVADTSANKKLRKLVINKIETETEDNADNFQIGTPTIAKK